MIPTGEDVRFFQEHRYWISPLCLSDDLETLRYGMERYFAGERDWPLWERLETDWTPEQGEVLR